VPFRTSHRICPPVAAPGLAPDPGRVAHPEPEQAPPVAASIRFHLPPLHLRPFHRLPTSHPPVVSRLLLRRPSRQSPRPACHLRQSYLRRPRSVLLGQGPVAAAQALQAVAAVAAHRSVAVRTGPLESRTGGHLRCLMCSVAPDSVRHALGGATDTSSRRLGINGRSPTAPVRDIVIRGGIRGSAAPDAWYSRCRLRRAGVD
jgi:hypothetical protein